MTGPSFSGLRRAGARTHPNSVARTLWLSNAPLCAAVGSELKACITFACFARKCSLAFANFRRLGRTPTALVRIQGGSGGLCAPARHGRCRCFIRLSTLASLSARPLQRRHRSLTGRRRVAISRSRSAERAVGQLVPQVRSLSLARVIPIHPPITCFLRARPLSRRRRLSSRLLSGFSARRLRRMRAHAHARARARRVPLRPSSSLARALRLAACALSRLRVFARAARIDGRWKSGSLLAKT